MTSPNQTASNLLAAPVSAETCFLAPKNEQSGERTALPSASSHRAGPMPPPFSPLTINVHGPDEDQPQLRRRQSDSSATACPDSCTCCCPSPPKNEQISSQADDDDECGDNVDGRLIRIPRTLELRHAVTIVMGIVIGSGVFVSPVGVLRHSGSFGAALLIWLACGFVATLGGLCYIELATLIQSSGGDYAYIFHAFGPVVSFLYLWVVLMIVLPSAIAVLAQTFSLYLLQSIRFDFGIDHAACGGQRADEQDGSTLVALSCLFLLIAVNCYNIEWANRIHLLFTSAKLFALLAIVVIGASVSISKAVKANDDDDASSTAISTLWTAPMKGSSTKPLSYALAFYVGIFSYAGWNSVTYVTEEIKQPEKNMPRAIMIALPLITTFYVAVNVAYFSALSFDELISSDAVAVTLGLKVSPLMARCFSISVMLSTFGAINGCIFVTSRLCFVGARSGCLPAVFSLIHIRRLTPVTALVGLGLVSTVYILFGSSVEQLIKYESFVELSFIGVTICGLLRLRCKWPKRRRPFQVPLAFPVTFLCILLFFMIVSLAYSTSESLWGVVLVATGLPVYFWLQRARRSPDCCRLAGDISLFAQKLFLAAHEEDCPASPRRNPNRSLAPSPQTSVVAASRNDQQEETTNN